jgi:hypothetical protein
MSKRVVVRALIQEDEQNERRRGETASTSSSWYYGFGIGLFDIPLSA